MQSIDTTEWLLFMALMIHLIMAPGTKVEESFNVQACHDILYHGLNLSAYDHHDFPGVVPRTFVGPIILSIPLFPVVRLFEIFSIPKYWSLVAVRFLLGSTAVLAFCNFARSVGKHFGHHVATFLRLITLSQFHILFYCSRPLPNIFAFIGVLIVYQLWLDEKFAKAVRVATVFTFLFRFELVLLFAPLFAVPLVYRRIPLCGLNGAVWNGIIALTLTLLLSVPIDSLMWRRLVWPEGEVVWFNVILNRSHEYGRYPFLWYFYSALPRALLASLPFCFVGVVLDRRLRYVFLPAALFILLYSLLPHKELRFIIYVFPLLNILAATACARMWINRQKSWFRFLIAVGFALHILANMIGTVVFVYASARNYPGANAIGYLQHMQRFDRNKPISVYIDNFAAQTGVSRFLQLYSSWEYNKTENLPPSDLRRFDFLLLGSYRERNYVKEVVANFSATHRVLFPVTCFERIRWRRSSKFPYFWPRIYLRDKMVVLKKFSKSR
ncbi:hypothetical protein AB6A40_000367 [Gnathostoma spinigerum]|uniref:Mannosyltransferase n=1 Tax=Gnathostoma spinigerum TaxID=75299 RepID=A0ABD6E211_9BILA